MDLYMTLGLGGDGDGDEAQRHRQRYINLKLAAAAQPVAEAVDDGDVMAASRALLDSYREKSRLLTDYLCPADRRIQDFLEDYLAGIQPPGPVRLPATTLVADRHGVARELSLPADGERFESEWVQSYRVRQGVLHNTKNDRRTTAGSFHIAEGGLPIPWDKKAVPRAVFAGMLHAALHPPAELMRLPFTAGQESQAKLFVSLLLRPLVCPEVPGRRPERRMEIRFFAPGSLVANLDFVESIFGNAGNPYLPENDAGLDVVHWSGHSGCVILAPHLLTLTKRELGLPHVSEASPRQLRDGMCWEDGDEAYNDGQPFKITARDARGAIVTLLTDNYFGYCKKEVKTQIGYAANLMGMAEEEHAGGALAFSRINHGDYFIAHQHPLGDHRFAEVRERYGALMDLQAEGYGVDRRYPDLLYVPEDLSVDLHRQRVSWCVDGMAQAIRLQPGKVYMHPSGYRLSMQKYPGGHSWRLVGTVPEGTFCHKPCTVSGGGKSEIAKPIAGAVLYGPLYVADVEADLEAVQAILDHDFSGCLLDGADVEQRVPAPGQSLLDPELTLGAAIRLLTPGPDTFTAEHNAWLEGIPTHVRSLVFLIKRFYRPEWAEDWRAHFGVDIVNGSPGHELKYHDRKLVMGYLRVGLHPSGAWRVFKLRQDYVPSAKVQMEDDITASTVVPLAELPNAPGGLDGPSVKLTVNCEHRLFQRPDDAVQRGLDAQTEWDMTRPDSFLANYEPLDTAAVGALVEDAIGLDKYTPPMQAFLRAALAEEARYTVSSAHPRLVDGRPSRNPRYLQVRPDLDDPFPTYAAEMGVRLNRRVPPDAPICHPVQAVLMGRRNNPPDPRAGICALAVYNPIHYQELPELFMDVIASLTGKSPSTTGAGSEGALTKGPFNALRPTADLNSALVAYVLTGYAGFSSAAGYIGPRVRVDHDISLLVPEIWARLPSRARDPGYLIENGYLEPLEDFEHRGRRVLASRLGYRITRRFVHAYLGRIFDSPSLAFDEAILKPETQDLDVFVEGVENIAETQRRVAQRYLDDGSVEDACPPLEALLHIMAEGQFRGMDEQDPRFRALFRREALLASDWYRERLLAQQQQDRDLWERHVTYLEAFLARDSHADQAAALDIRGRLDLARKTLARVIASDYPDTLIGTLGADPSLCARRSASAATLRLVQG
jgi:hypothetical protein